MTSPPSSLQRHSVWQWKNRSLLQRQAQVGLPEQSAARAVSLNVEQDGVALPELKTSTWQKVWPTTHVVDELPASLLAVPSDPPAWQAYVTPSGASPVTSNPPSCRFARSVDELQPRRTTSAIGNNAGAEIGAIRRRREGLTSPRRDPDGKYEN